jgi:hypothetical protein
VHQVDDAHASLAEHALEDELKAWPNLEDRADLEVRL